MPAARKKTLRTCPKGHRYYKSTGCPTCPKCEADRKPKSGLLSRLSAPARSALEHEGITTVAKLARYTEKEILKLHGVGPSSLPTLKEALAEAGKAFKKNA